MLVYEEKKKRVWPKRSQLKTGALAAVGFIILAAATFTGFFQRVYFRLVHQPRMEMRALKELPVLRLDLPFESCLSLYEKRNQAIARGITLAEEKVYVKGMLQHGDEQMKIKIRLKGDWVDHMAGDKWSFRVKVDSDSSVLGLKEFSLNVPETRVGIYEWAYLENLRAEGILAPRTSFVYVVLNGKPRGLYSMEEFFTPILPQAQNRREGFIVRPDETDFWNHRAWERSLNGFKTSVGLVKKEFDDRIDFEADLRDLKKYPKYVEAMNATVRLYDPEAPVDEFLDLDKFAKFLAISDLWNAKHGLANHNLRFYFNEIDHRLEPIGYDGMGGPTYDFNLKLISFEKLQTSLINKLLASREFVEKYLSYVQEYSSPEYLEKVQKIVERENFYGPFLAALTLAAPRVDMDFMRDSQARMRLAIIPTTPARAFFAVAQSKVEVAVENISQLPILLDKIAFGSFSLDADSILTVAKLSSQGEKALLIAPHSTKTFQLDGVLAAARSIASTADGSTVDIYTRFPGVKTAHKTVAFDYLPNHSRTAISSFPKAVSRTVFLSSFPFVQAKELNHYVIPRGNWRVSQQMITPTGSTLTVQSGATLSFNENAGIIAHGTLRIEGTIANPVHLVPTGKSWQGIFVQDGKQESLIRHAVIRGPRGWKLGNWESTGAITFHRAPVRIEDSQFQVTTADDFLNLVLSPFSIANSKFANTKSDAIDADYSKGSMTNCNFEHVSKDAVEVSGSTLELKQLGFVAVGDKAINANEQSKVKGSSITILDSNKGIAIKDKSEAEFEGVSLTNTEYGVLAFHKKPEFGGSTLTIKDLKEDNVKTSHLVRNGSKAIINGVPVEITAFNPDKF